MQARDPISKLPTHEVTNMPPHIGDQDLWRGDKALIHWTKAMGGTQHESHFSEVGQKLVVLKLFSKRSKQTITR